MHKKAGMNTQKPGTVHYNQTFTIFCSETYKSMKYTTVQDKFYEKKNKNKNNLRQTYKKIFLVFRAFWNPIRIADKELQSYRIVPSIQ